MKYLLNEIFAPTYRIWRNVTALRNFIFTLLLVFCFHELANLINTGLWLVCLWKLLWILKSYGFVSTSIRGLHALRTDEVFLFLFLTIGWFLLPMHERQQNFERKEDLFANFFVFKITKICLCENAQNIEKVLRRSILFGAILCFKKSSEFFYDKIYFHQYEPNIFELVRYILHFKFLNKIKKTRLRIFAFFATNIEGLCHPWYDAWTRRFGICPFL